MKLRDALEPKMDIAEALYPKLFALIQQIEDYYDHSDVEGMQAGLNQIDQLVPEKKVKLEDVLENYEAEGAEVLAFRIGLPNPALVKDFSKAELLEVVARIKTDTSERWEQVHTLSFKETFSLYLTDYYHALLKLNFKRYQFSYFGRNKIDGVYTEFSIHEIVDKIWA